LSKTGVEAVGKLRRRTVYEQQLLKVPATVSSNKIQKIERKFSERSRVLFHGFDPSADGFGLFSTLSSPADDSRRHAVGTQPRAVFEGAQ